MRPVIAGALVALFVVACDAGTTGNVASTPRTAGSPAASSPAPATMSTKLNCGDSHVGATALAIYQYSTTPPFIEILDVSNPLRPSLVCTLSPAFGARFLSATKLAFWIGKELGTADLSTGAITRTALLPAQAGRGTFSADGKKFAYRSYDDAGAMSTHLYVAGSDRTLYVQEPLGGHGAPGPSFGPLDQLEFSPEGSLLLDDLVFRPQSGPAHFIVFKSDGSILFQSNAATNGIWSPVGNTLFFYGYGQPGQPGELDVMTVDGQRQMLATGINGLWWPRMSPDGRSIFYNASDNSVPDCGGVPHLWRVDLTTGRATQISTAISSDPFFIQPNVMWSDEQQLSPCGPGGPSTTDGVILSHDLRTGHDATVDTTLIVPGIGGPPLPPPSTFNLLDTWFAAA